MVTLKGSISPRNPEQIRAQTRRRGRLFERTCHTIFAKAAFVTQSPLKRREFDAFQRRLPEFHAAAQRPQRYMRLSSAMWGSFQFFGCSRDKVTCLGAGVRAAPKKAHGSRAPGRNVGGRRSPVDGRQLPLTTYQPNREGRQHPSGNHTRTCRRTCHRCPKEYR